MRHLRHRPARVPRRPDLRPHEGGAAPAHRRVGAGHARATSSPAWSPRLGDGVGDGRSGLRVGDKVVVEPYIVCGRCDACRTGSYNVCATLGFVGLSGYGGGFSQYVVAEERWIHPLGDLGTDVGALIEPLAVAYHAVTAVRCTTGTDGARVRCGPDRAGDDGALRAAGVEDVIVVEPADVRKAKAPGAGATHVLDPTATDITERSPRSPAGAVPTSPSSAQASTRSSSPRSCPPGPEAPASTSRSGVTRRRWR